MSCISTQVIVNILPYWVRQFVSTYHSTNGNENAPRTSESDDHRSSILILPTPPDYPSRPPRAKIQHPSTPRQEDTTSQAEAATAGTGPQILPSPLYPIQPLKSKAHGQPKLQRKDRWSGWSDWFRIGKASICYSSSTSNIINRR